MPYHVFGGTLNLALSVCLSFIYRNLCIICKNVGCLVDDFSAENVNLCNLFFDRYNRNTV